MGCGTFHKDGVLIEALWPNFNSEVNFWLHCMLLVPAGEGELLCPRAEVQWDLAAHAVQELTPFT